MLHGTSPYVLRYDSTALILVINSPLSSEDPRPKILLPIIRPLKGGSAQSSMGSIG